MKVIKKGRNQKGWAKEFICTGEGNGNGGCEAILLVEEGDLFQTESHHYDSSTDYYTTFKCKECGVLTDIPKNLYRGALPKKEEWLKKNGVSQ